VTRAIDSAGGLVSMVGMPVSGALGLVGAVTSGIAASAGIATHPPPRRSGRTLRAAEDVRRFASAKLLLHPAMAGEVDFGRYITHCPALQVSSSSVEAAGSLEHPTVLLMERAVVVFAEGALLLALVVTLRDAEAVRNMKSHEISIIGSARGSSPPIPEGAGGQGVVSIRLEREDWLHFAPLLQRQIYLEQCMRG
jgi:hypothetical protein